MLSIIVKNDILLGRAVRLKAPATGHSLLTVNSGLVSAAVCVCDISKSMSSIIVSEFLCVFCEIALSVKLHLWMCLVMGYGYG